MCYFVIEDDFPNIDFLSCFGRCQEIVKTPTVNIVEKLVNEFKCTFLARVIERALEHCGEESLGLITNNEQKKTHI